MKSIVLPAGTEHVQFGELAHLIADAQWPAAGPDDDRMDYAFPRINLDAELARAVVSGALPVKDPLTLGPHTYPVGYALKTALVTVDDLKRFVSDRGLSVIVETPERQAADALAAKGGAPPATSLNGGEWRVKAREFAREYLDRYKAQDLFPSQPDVCEYLEERLRKEKIYGAHGKPVSASYIARNAIQGEWWKDNKR